MAQDQASIELTLGLVRAANNTMRFATIVADNFKEIYMSTPVRIDDQLYEQAKAHALAERRSIAGQIEFWAMVGKAALDNPDLPIDFVRDLLVARAEGPTLATQFVPQGRA